MRIVGLHGLPRTGKDTIALRLTTEFGFHRLAFADALKSTLARTFGVTVEYLNSHKVTPTEKLALINCVDHQFYRWCSSQLKMLEPRTSREVMQIYGTDFAQSVFGKTVWSDRLKFAASFCLVNGASVVVSDVRFEHEVEALQTLGNTFNCPVEIWMVTRPGTSGSQHISDKSLPLTVIDEIITNDTGLAGLYDQVDYLYKKMLLTY